jgi:phosphoglycolate phosphatase
LTPGRLILWDIDGTLIRAGAIGAAIFDRALELAIGVPPAGMVSMGGKTDPQIVREHLELMEVADIDGRLPVILGHLEREMAAGAGSLADGGYALPGVPELLARLAGVSGVRQSVLTGNIAPNAVVKLAAFGLDRWLDLEVGAYGSDHADRNQLVPIAIDRVRRLRGEVIGADDVWVVGDTANDLACARAGGARCLLVGTGRVDVSELAGLGPDAVLPDLADTDTVATLLVGGRLPLS